MPNLRVSAQALKRIFDTLHDLRRMGLIHGCGMGMRKLAVAAPSTFAQLCITPLLAVFMDRYTDLTLDLHLSDAQFDLIEGSYDLALRNPVLEDSSSMARKLADDKRLFCASPEYLVRIGTSATPTDLVSQRFVAFRNLDTKYMISLD